MESNVMTMRVKGDRAWPLFKLVDKYSLYQKEVLIYDHDDKPIEVEVQFVLKKILGSTKLTKLLLTRKAKKELL